MTSFDGDKKIETKYTAEFVTDKKDYAYIIGGRCNDGEPWEKYQKKEFDDLDKALEFYMRGLVDDSFLDIKLFEQIFVDGVCQRESFIEPPNTLRFYLRTTVNKELEKEIRSLREKNERLNEVGELMREFVCMYHMEDRLNEFIKEKSKFSKQPLRLEGSCNRET